MKLAIGDVMQNMAYHRNTVFTPRPIRPEGYCRRLCPAVRNIWLVRTISQKPLLGITPNLVCMCILPSFQHLLIMGDLDLHLKGHLALKHSKLGHFGLVRTISQKVLHGIHQISTEYVSDLAFNTY